MPRYAITEKAGPFVAAHRNTGVGTLLDLTEHQAEHELRLGTLVRVRDIAEAQPERSAPHACRATIKVRHVFNQGETAPGWTADGRA